MGFTMRVALVLLFLATVCAVEKRGYVPEVAPSGTLPGTTDGVAPSQGERGADHLDGALTPVTSDEGDVAHAKDDAIMIEKAASATLQDGEYDAAYIGNGRLGEGSHPRDQQRVQELRNLQPAEEPDAAKDAAIQKTMKEAVDQAHTGSSKAAKGGEAANKLLMEAAAQRNLDAKADQLRVMDKALKAVDEYAHKEVNDDKLENADGVKLQDAGADPTTRKNYDWIEGKVNTVSKDMEIAADKSTSLAEEIEDEVEAAEKTVEKGPQKELGEVMTLEDAEKQGEKALTHAETKSHWMETKQRHVMEEGYNLEEYVLVKIGKNSEK